MAVFIDRVAMYAAEQDVLELPERTRRSSVTT
jgi:hypothetical protein